MCKFAQLYACHELFLNKGKAKRGVSPRQKNKLCDLENQYGVCTKFDQNPLKDVDSSVHKDVTQ